jgi:hypothetical protein
VVMPCTQSQSLIDIFIFIVVMFKCIMKSLEYFDIQ